MIWLLNLRRRYWEWRRDQALETQRRLAAVREFRELRRGDHSDGSPDA